MADQPAKKSPVTLEYESPGAVWQSGHYLGCAIVLISFLLIAWIWFGFILALTATLFDFQMTPRMRIAAIFASGAIALIATVIAYWRVMHLRR